MAPARWSAPLPARHAGGAARERVLRWARAAQAGLASWVASCLLLRLRGRLFALEFSGVARAWRQHRTGASVVEAREANNSFSEKRAFGWLEVGICPNAGGRARVPGRASGRVVRGITGAPSRAARAGSYDFTWTIHRASHHNVI
ncbi:hypothetical protein PUN4_870031 [Paraburkholderia unamae]|nr:hypothetical protein PUN4_870031 [Paraburkholderia unamae]